jgi:hypothetical protein
MSVITSANSGGFKSVRIKSRPGIVVWIQTEFKQRGKIYGVALTSFPENTTGPVGAPVGEPPFGSTLTA